MARYGIKVTPSHVLITSGSQQALDLIGKLLINPGDVVLTEEPTYLGALQAFTAYQARYVTVPVDDDGHAAWTSSRRRCAPGPSSSTSCRTSRTRRASRSPSSAASAWSSWPAATARRSSRTTPTASSATRASTCPRWSRSTPSTTAAPTASGRSGAACSTSARSPRRWRPGLRLGWVVAPEEVIAQAGAAQAGRRPPHQHVHPDGGLRGGPGRLPRPARATIREVYRERRDAMLAALERHFPAGVRWTRPRAGCSSGSPCRRASTPRRCSRRRSSRRRWPSCPARPSSRGGAATTLPPQLLRTPRPDLIDEGIRRLGSVVKRKLVRP